MGLLSHLFFPWGIILQGLAIVHFIRRRPDGFWMYIILFLGPPGALIYLIAEALPDVGLLRAGFQVFPRRQRIRELEALVRVNPSSGNWEELGDLLMEDGKLAAAREAFERAIAARASTLDPFYRRGVCALLLGDAAAAIPDLERTVEAEFDYDFYRAAGLLAQAYAVTGGKEKALELFAKTTVMSTRSETYLNYAELLVAEGRTVEAREQIRKVLDKSLTSPGYLRRRERPWTRRAKKMLKQLPA